MRRHDPALSESSDVPITSPVSFRLTYVPCAVLIAMLMDGDQSFFFCGRKRGRAPFGDVSNCKLQFLRSLPKSSDYPKLDALLITAVLLYPWFVSQTPKL
jgi:hypothetical protein